MVATVWCARMSCMPLFYRRVYNYSKKMHAVFDKALQHRDVFAPATTYERLYRDRQRCHELVRQCVEHGSVVDGSVHLQNSCAEYVDIALKVRDVLSRDRRELPVGLTLPAYLARTGKYGHVEAVAREMFADAFVQQCKSASWHYAPVPAPVYYFVYGGVLSGRTSLLKSVAYINGLMLPAECVEHVYGSVGQLDACDVEDIQDKRDANTKYALYVDDVHEGVDEKVIVDLTRHTSVATFAALSFDLAPAAQGDDRNDVGRETHLAASQRHVHIVTAFNAALKHHRHINFKVRSI